MKRFLPYLVFAILTRGNLFSQSPLNNALPLLVESTVASASSIAPVSAIVLITGTTQINTITVPTGCTTSGGNCYILLEADSATGPFTLGTSGNIGVTLSPTAGTMVALAYRPATSKWYPLGGASVSLFYQTVDANGSAQTQRSAINLINGTNVTITCVDNSGANRTDCTVSSSGGGGSGTGGSYASSFTSQTSVTIAGTTHNLGTSNIIVGVVDTASPANVIAPANVTIDPSTFNVVVTFASSQSGTIILIASAGKYVAAFTNQTALSIPASTHNLGASIFHVTVYDASSGTRNRIEPGSLQIDASGNVTVNFAVPQSGQIVIE